MSNRNRSGIISVADGIVDLCDRMERLMNSGGDGSNRRTNRQITNTDKTIIVGVGMGLAAMSLYSMYNAISSSNAADDTTREILNDPQRRRRTHDEDNLRI